jgi:hypothetical protein
MKNLALIFVVYISILVISASALAQTQTNTPITNPETKPASTPNTESSPLSPELKQRVKEKYEEYAAYTLRWSGVYWGSVFGAAILSALSGIFLKLDAFKDKRILMLSQTDIAAILAGIAALLITISSAGDFSGKWKANRAARDHAEILNNELYNSKVAPEEVVTQLNKIIEDQDRGVINESTQGRDTNKNNNSK